MTSEELFSVWTLRAELEKEKHRCQDLQVLAENTTKSLDGMPPSKNVVAKTEKFALAITECKNKIYSLSEQIVQQQFVLMTKLKELHLPELQFRILNYRYVATLPFKAIAKLLNYTMRHISNLHAKALKKLGLSEIETGSYKISCQFLSVPTSSV